MTPPMSSSGEITAAEWREREARCERDGHLFVTPLHDESIRACLRCQQTEEASSGAR